MQLCGYSLTSKDLLAWVCCVRSMDIYRLKLFYSNFARNKRDRKSTSAYCTYVGGYLVT